MELINQYRSDNESNWRRAGFRTLLKRAIDKNIFKKEGLDAYDSAFYEDFEKILLYFSIENAIV